MKRIVGLVLLLAMAGSGDAWARSYHTHRPRLHSVRLSTHVRPARRPSMHHRSRLASLSASRSDDGRTQAGSRVEEASGPAEHPGWFKGQHEAGWGFSNSRSTTVVGLYQRPEEPQGLPENQVYHHDSRGAAGVSLSFKLGG